MLEFKDSSFEEVQPYFVDFQKLAHCFEMPSEDALYVGIYDTGKFIGYYVLAAYEDRSLEIQQGYLLPEARNKRNHIRSMQLLETKAKELGFTSIVLQAQRSLKAYTHFMSKIGFRPQRIVYGKSI